jgi:hypothetical protein
MFCGRIHRHASQSIPIKGFGFVGEVKAEQAEVRFGEMRVKREML